MTNATRARAEADDVATARFFRALADPTRLAIVSHLLGGPHTVSELMEKIGAPQSRISNHLACLRWCRFVTCERQGREIVYQLVDRRLRRLLVLADELATENCEHLATCKRIGPAWL